jgi:hypothetical protein
VRTVGGRDDTELVRNDYYSVVAQLIPLLYVTLIIEYRLLHQLPTSASPFLDAVGGVVLGTTAIVFMVSEAQVLAALKSGHASAAADGGAKAALVLGGVALVFPIQQRGLDLVQAMPSRKRRWAATGVGLLVTMLAIFLAELIR